MSRISSAFLFQWNHPTTVESLFPLRVKNVGPRSLITRACQGFLQKIAFPLQFEFLFSFPGNLLDPEVFEEPLRGDFAVSNSRPDDRRPGPTVRGEAEGNLIKGKKPIKEWFATYW